ncbi:MAG: glycosyltransferase family 2 protein [candidate division Zixibacteria bacterium]|nr:glycosyltransferase family 2 protein [candidate division Zixibacteria bacterium]
MNDKPSISAIVISYHGMEFVPDCLKTLAENLKGYDNEIIVIDNHSTDGTVEFIEENYPAIKLIKNRTNAGFAKAVNQGLQITDNDYVWILNQDIRISNGCLNSLIACYEQLPNPGMIGPRLVGFDGKLQRFCRRFPRYHHLLFELIGLSFLFPDSKLFNGWKMGDFDHCHSRSVPQPMGAAMLLKRECINNIGLMDESFGIFFNDVDYCERLEIAGYRNYYCCEAVLEHYQGGSVSRQKPKMVWLSHGGMFKYFVKYEKRRRSGRFSRIIRLPLSLIAGLLLFISAIPRSVYHWLRKFI